MREEARAWVRSPDCKQKPEPDKRKTEKLGEGTGKEAETVPKGRSGDAKINDSCSQRAITAFCKAVDDKNLLNF